MINFNDLEIRSSKYDDLKHYYLNGKPFTGLAKEFNNNCLHYLVNGVHHREDGAAKEYLNYPIDECFYYKGEFITNIKNKFDLFLRREKINAFK